jgi:hypothetical protein
MQAENLTDDEINWIVTSINNEIGRIYKQAQSFDKLDSWKYKRENEAYIKILLSAKTKLILKQFNGV